LCLTFSIWAFTFAAVNAAETSSEALFWRRISVLGWGLSFSVFLHYMMVLTDSKWIRKKNLPLLLSFLYIPSLAFIFLFGLYDPTAAAQYQLIHTGFGWTVVVLDNGLTCLLNGYFLFFSLVVCAFLIRWRQSARDTQNKKQASLLLIAFILALLSGSFTDLIAYRILPMGLPPLSPLMILFLVSTMLYIMYRYNFMVARKEANVQPEGEILSFTLHRQLFRWLGIFLAAGSAMNYFLWMNLSNSHPAGMTLSLAMMLSGAFIVAAPYLFDDFARQNQWMYVIIALMLPMIVLTYSDGFFSNIIWPTPIFFVILTVVFNSRRIAYIISVTSLLLCLYFWVTLPNYTVAIGPVEFFFRLIFYGVAIVLTGFIRYIYQSRLEDNKQQKRFQNLVTELSTNFIIMSPEEFDEKVNGFLKNIAHFFKADRAYIGGLSRDGKWLLPTHFWVNSTAVETTDGGPPTRIPTDPFCNQKLMNNEVVLITSLNNQSATLLDREITALVQLPIFDAENQLQGIIGFESQQKGKPAFIKRWGKFHDSQFKMLSNLLSEGVEKINVERELSHLAYFDTLTNLPNRRLFEKRLNEAINDCQRFGNRLGIIFLDLDGFKTVNDTLGHDWGDRLLTEIARRLTAVVGKGDTVARFGGDEFLILLPRINTQADLSLVASKIMAALETPVSMNQQEYHLSASGGISLYPQDGKTAGLLIKNADLAMYEAKDKGKGLFIFCSRQMRTDLAERVALTNSLHEALARQELLLHYQPQVSSRTGEVIGYEALLRWNHPEKGLLSPAVFIPLAEQSGLIGPIGQWVLMTACKQNKDWQDKGYPPVPMAVNLSVEQFRQSDMVEVVKTCLSESGLNPAYLELEITESIAMEESAGMATCLSTLKELGVSISIDDFGTEFSSLSRLKDLPVDRIKIDMQFIRGIGHNPKDESIISVMIHLARSLNLKIIAEGVETETQLGFLKNEDCHEIQGYYYYRPLSQGAIESEIYRGDPKCS
jgi:diguanylate cyclase (GGDEF)-like protein